MATQNIEFDDDIEPVKSSEKDEQHENPFYSGEDSDYFRARRGERGAALARQIVEVMENDPGAIDEIPLGEVVYQRHSRATCLYMPNARRKRGHGRCRTVYCVDLGESGGTWAGHSLTDQFRMISILLHGDLMSKALNEEKDWRDLLPTELIIITDHWNQEVAEWVPMLRVWTKLVKHFEMYLVAPGIVQGITFEP